MRKKNSENLPVTDKLIKKILKTERKIENIPELDTQTVEFIIKKVVSWAEKKTIVTQSEFDKKLANEVKKFNTDLGFMIEQRNKLV
ncbi:hypothetical protein HG471_001935 [Candidatus Saccharibacteria bacterium]|nr:hypothetical protein [Candidatus Saccharibacteria bacterium]